jgi:hypothetical protein
MAETTLQRLYETCGSAQAATNKIDNVFENYDELISVVEDLWILYLQFRNSKVDKRKETLFLSSLCFIKKRCRKSLTRIAYANACTFLEKAIYGFGGLRAQGFEENVKSARNVFDSVETFTSSDLYGKFHRVMMYCLTFSLFEKFGLNFDNLGFTSLEKATTQKKFSNKSSFVKMTIDLIIFICERGVQVMSTGDINTIFHSGKVYDELFEEIKIVQRQQKLLHDPESFGFSESEFFDRLESLIEKMTSVKKHSFSLSKNDKKMISFQLDNLCMMRDDLLTKRNARKTRDAPFALMIYGDSSIGKTTITENIFQYFCKLKNLPNGSEFKYSKNPAAKYWDGYTSACHTIVFDDIACENPDKVMGASSLDEVIRTQNNNPYCPDQASLENKGTTPMKAKLLIGTSNVFTLNASHFFSCPSAVQRRFPFIIEPKVKPEYRRDDSNLLDSSKVSNRDAFPDLWTYDIYVVKPVPINKNQSKQRLATPELIHEGVGKKEFYSWLRNEILKFDDNQRIVRESVQNTREAKLCVCCDMPPGCCNNVQGKISMGIFSIFFTGLLSLVFFKRFRAFRRAVRFCSDRIFFDKSTAIYHYLSDVADEMFTRQNFISMGQQVQMALTSRSFVAFASLVAFLAVVRKYMKTLEAQGGISSHDVGKVPIAELNGRENVWYNNDVQLSHADFTRESRSSKGMTFEEFNQKVSRNVFKFKIRNADKSIRTGTVTVLYGQIFLTNNHILSDISSCAECWLFGKKQYDNTPNLNFFLCENQIVRNTELDIAVFFVPNFRPRRNILNYFIRSKGSGSLKGNMLVPNTDGSISTVPVENIRMSKDMVSGFGMFRHSTDRWQSSSETMLKDGDCGSLLIARTGVAYAILGIHVASNPGARLLVSTFVDIHTLERMIEKLNCPKVQAGNLSLISSESVDRKVVDLHKKSVFRYMQEPIVELYGSFTDFRAKGNTTVCPTPMSYVLTNHGYKFKYTKPVMKGWVPWHIGAKDLVQPIQTLNEDLLRNCMEQYFEDICQRIECEQVSEMVHILDDFTAVNGAQVAYIDKINRNSSAGNPWKKSKKYFITEIAPNHGMLDPVEFTTEIMDRVDYILDRYSEGEMVHPNFCAHLKDEAVSFKKAQTGKTRVFTGAPVDWTIVVRKYLLGFTRLLQNNRIAFESAPGTIAQSLEWEELYGYITTFGTKRIIAGDYAKYDKRMSPMEIIVAFELIKKFCVMSGNYTERDMLIIDCICYDTAFPTVDYNGDLVGLYGSNPSGNPLTVILNSIVNCIRNRYCYHILNPQHEVKTFKKNICLMTYGDDNIMGVSEDCPWFTHTALQKIYAMLDIEYTMADKDAESIPYIDMNSATFLKRKWVYDADMDCQLCVLEHESIEKMLMTWNKSKVICEESQGIAVITSANQEYFFYGKEVYHEKQKLLKDLVEELGWTTYVEDSTFPTYQELVERFKTASKTSKLYKEKGW